MNILIINHYAGAPSIGMEYRHYYLADQWQKSGHNVLIVCASFTHLRSRQFNLKSDSEKTVVDGINYLVFKTPEYYGNYYNRVLNIISFVRKLSKQVKQISEEFKPDVVIASSTFVFDIYSAKKIADLSGARLIFEVHDLWPLSPMELGGYSKWHPYIMFMQKAENYAYKNSDKVVSLLPNTLDYMVEHGLAPEKFVYIPNGIVEEDWETIKDIPETIAGLLKKLKCDGNKLIGYAGNLGIANALDALVESMRLLENENVHLVFVGKGPEKEKLRNQAKTISPQKIHFIDVIPKTLIPSILDKLNILYIGLKNQPVFRFGISPNKLMDYMMAGKPVIQAIKAGNDIVAEAECGITVEPENPQAIAEAVKYLISQSDDYLGKIGENGKKYCIANHNYKILAEKFLNSINSPVSKSA